MVHAQQDEVLQALLHWLHQINYQFITITPASHARVNSRPENAWAKDVRDVFGWSRPFRANSNIIPDDLLKHLQEVGAVVSVQDGWKSKYRVSTLLEKLLLIHSAYPTDAADAVFFGPDTYRFVTAIQKHLESRAHFPKRAVDIGCGAGPGAIAVAHNFPESEVFGVDINDGALQLTRVNASVAKCSKMHARFSNLLTGVEGEFDLIVSNPPYLVDPTERAYRHGGGPLGAGLSLQILDAALTRLATKGTLLLYTGAAIVNGVDPFKEEAVKHIPSDKFEWKYEEMDPDVFGEELEGGVYAVADRIAAVVLTVIKK